MILLDRHRAQSLLAHLPEPPADSARRLIKADTLLKAVVHPADLPVMLRRAELRLSPAPSYVASLTLSDQGVVLGKGAVIVPLDEEPGLAVPGNEERILALLLAWRRGNWKRDAAVRYAEGVGGTPLPPGYRQIDPNTDEGRAELAKLGITKDDLSPPGSSMDAELFVKDGRYVLAFRGTRLGEAADWENNAEQGAGFGAEAYDDAIRLANKLAQETDGNLSFTGHSLGGGLASAAAVATGLPATTFNAAGLDTASITNPSSTPPQVDACYVPGEILSAIQDNRVVTVPAIAASLQGIPYVGTAVAGIVIAQEALGHAVLAPAYGTRQRLPVAMPPGSASDTSISRHSMDWVISGIEAKQAQLQGQ